MGKSLISLHPRSHRYRAAKENNLGGLQCLFGRPETLRIKRKRGFKFGS